MNYSGNDNCRTQEEEKPERQLAACEYFTTNALSLEGCQTRDYTEIDSFVIYICTEGQTTVEYGSDQNIQVSKGETLLLPAEINTIKLNSNEASKLLEVYI